MLWLAYLLLALAVACALHQRARRKAAEWDRGDEADGLRSLYRQSQGDLERVCRERDDAQAEADRLERAVNTCRVHTQQAIQERDDARQELQVLRGDQEQRARSHGDSVRCAAEREKLVEGYARDILTALGREAP